MLKGSLNYRDLIDEYGFLSCACKRCDPRPCPAKPCRCCCIVPAGPFLSSYIEAVGSTQSIESGHDIVFDVDEATLDIAGEDIELDESGSIFKIKRAGLYHIEWSVNLSEGAQPVLICLMENGEPSSALSNTASTGNYSSGALINVTDAEVPYEISLRNFGGRITIVHPELFGNTAASIRILRFADGSASKF